MTNSIEARVAHSSGASEWIFDEEPVLSSDVMMPAQFYAAGSAPPCQRLLAAVLEDAIRCFQKNCGATSARRHIIFQEAEAWLFDLHGTGFMSFQTLCENLEIDPIQLWRYLRKWKRNKQAALPAPLIGGVRLASTRRTRVSSLTRDQKVRGGVRL